MIHPPGFRGAAFAAAADGDARRHRPERLRLSRRLGIAAEWAYPSQVHGTRVVKATGPGAAGEADAIFTTVPGLPVTVATADCAPVIFEGPGVVGVVHAGWRGAVAGVVPAFLAAMDRAGLVVERAAIGPAIGPCCYEVGAEVADRFGSHVASTRHGTVSADIAGYLREQLGGLDVWVSDVCTYDSATHHSYRRAKTKERQVAVAWIPA